MANISSISNPYAVLGVPKDATQEEIKRAFRQQAAKTHPDRNPGDQDAEVRFKEINAAFQILSDPAKRAEYDRNKVLDPTSDRKVARDDRNTVRSPKPGRKVPFEEMEAIKIQMIAAMIEYGQDVPEKSRWGVGGSSFNRAIEAADKAKFIIDNATFDLLKTINPPNAIVVAICNRAAKIYSSGSMAFDKSLIAAVTLAIFTEKNPPVSNIGEKCLFKVINSVSVGNLKSIKLAESSACIAGW